VFSETSTIRVLLDEKSDVLGVVTNFAFVSEFLMPCVKEIEFFQGQKILFVRNECLRSEWFSNVTIFCLVNSLMLEISCLSLHHAAYNENRNGCLLTLTPLLMIITSIHFEQCLLSFLRFDSRFRINIFLNLIQVYFFVSGIFRTNACQCAM